MQSAAVLWAKNTLLWEASCKNHSSKQNAHMQITAQCNNSAVSENKQPIKCWSGRATTEGDHAVFHSCQRRTRSYSDSIIIRVYNWWMEVCLLWWVKFDAVDCGRQSLVHRVPPWKLQINKSRNRGNKHHNINKYNKLHKNQVLCVLNMLFYHLHKIHFS